MDFGLVYLVLKIASNNCACDFLTRFCSNILSNWRRIALHLSIPGKYAEEAKLLTNAVF